MTRKRFIKKLMGTGASRNRAVALAQRRPANESYESYWGRAVFVSSMMDVGISSKKACKSFVQLSGMMQNAAQSVSSIAESFAYIFACKNGAFQEETPPC